MIVNIVLLAAGLGLLLGLRWLRRRFTGWVHHSSDFRMVGYLLPLAGLALTLTGAGMFWVPAPIGTYVPNDCLLVVLVAGLLCFVLAFAAVLGVPMPAVLLPRWYRESRPDKPRSDPDGGVTP